MKCFPFKRKKKNQDSKILESLNDLIDNVEELLPEPTNIEEIIEDVVETVEDVVVDVIETVEEVVVSTDAVIEEKFL